MPNWSAPTGPRSTTIRPRPTARSKKALRITCSANTDYKRTGTLRVTLSKTGESVDFPITQVGLKPDTLTLSTESDIEMMALEPAEVTVTFETNMPASTVTAELEEGGGVAHLHARQGGRDGRPRGWTTPRPPTCGRRR